MPHAGAREDSPTDAGTTIEAAFEERPVVIDHGTPPLPGTLTLPRGEGPFPAVLLVHGSGPHDRDETIGPNKPFRDIAHGLAARGIASLRYDKRAKVSPFAFAGRDYTVDDETTDDAVAALALLHDSAGIDRERVHVLGHSLGGMLAPRIVQRSQDRAAGAILFAAPARPLMDLLLEQLGNMASLDGAVSAAERASLDATADQVRRIRAGERLPAGQGPLGASSAYWTSAEAVDAVADARTLGRRVLVLHGGRDIQVVDADWTRWQAGLSGVPYATLKLYPALSHLGIAGEGPGSPADYTTPGRVDDTLLDDLAAWILDPAEPARD